MGADGCGWVRWGLGGTGDTTNKTGRGCSGSNTLITTLAISIGSYEYYTPGVNSPKEIIKGNRFVLALLCHFCDREEI